MEVFDQNSVGSPDMSTESQGEQIAQVEVVSSDALTQEERQLLATLENQIDHGAMMFETVGKAMEEIRVSRLYRTTHKTFEDYLRDRFGFERGHAYGLMKSAKIVENLVAAQLPAPANEFQIRPLGKLSAENQIKVWGKVIAEAGDGKVTHDQVKAAADEIEGKKQPVEFVDAEGAVPFDNRLLENYWSGDLAGNASKIEEKSVDLLLISNLTDESESEASSELDDLLGSVELFMKDDSQALVFCPYHDFHPLSDIAKKRGYELGVPVYRDRSKAKKIIEFSFLDAVDVILHLRKGKAKLHDPTSNIILAEDESPKSHPSQKPVAFLSDLICTAIAPGAVVLDPKAGVGSSLLACHSVGRTCIAIEADEAVYKIGVRRLQTSQSSTERNSDHV